MSGARWRINRRPGSVTPMTTTTAKTLIGQEPVTPVTRETALFIVTDWVSASGETVYQDWTLKP
jgi:hypothetical protein